MTAWTDFVSKIHKEGQVKDPNYSFKQAMQDASARKGEMNGSSSSSSSIKSTKTNTSKKSKKGGKKASKKRKSVTRRKRRSVKKH
jgi:hypothetical protein